MNPYKVYISGPMQTKPGFNFPQFHEAEEWLQSIAGRLHLGMFGSIEIVNPARNFNGDTTLGREVYLELALRQVDECDCIVMLPEWEQSPGARLELARALHNGSQVFEWHPGTGGKRVFLPISRSAAEERLDETATPMEAPASRIGSGPFAPTINSLRRAQGLESFGPDVPEADLPYVETRRGPVFIEGEITQFASGATRDTSKGKLDYEGFLSPQVLERYAEYMNEHRTQSDGKLRDADNWQKGFTRASYMKSMWRHFMDSWLNHRGHKTEASHEEALCGVIFNASGYLFELLRDRDLSE